MLCSNRIGSWRPLWGVAAISAIVVGWCLQSPSFADDPIGVQSVLVEPRLQRPNEGGVGNEVVLERDQGIPWRHVASSSDLGEGGVAGPACLCNEDCDVTACDGGICTGGVCSFDNATANGDACDDGDPDGKFCTTGLCLDGACTPSAGDAGVVCPGADGDAGTGDDDICDESQDRCEQCVVDGDCPFVDEDDPCAPQRCNAEQRCELAGFLLPCVGTFGCELDINGEVECLPIDTDGRCCFPDDTPCQEDITRASCEGMSGLWNAIGVCPCPKYGAGITPDAFIEGTGDTVFELLVEPAGNCDTRSILGDDYTLENGSFLSWEYMQIVLEVEADNTDLLFTFYDQDFNVLGTDNVIDLDVDGNNDGEPDGPIRILNGPSLGQIILTPIGWWTVEVTTDTGGVIFRSTDAVDVGSNNPDLMWENNTQGQILPAGQNILMIELAGSKVEPPFGACCDDPNPCVEGVLPWECAGNHVLGGTCPDACSFGSCCLANGFCCDPNNLGVDAGCTSTVISSQANCEGASGVWNGIATDCSTDCCVQDPTGSTVCSGAVDHPLDISGACAPDGDGGFTCPSASATYTGDTRGITNGTCSVSGLPCATNTVPVPGGNDTTCNLSIEGDVCVADDDWCALLGASSGGGDPVYFEKFSINQDANVTIEYCGTGFCPGQDPGPGPNGGVNVRYIVLLPACQEDGPDTCGSNESIIFDPDASQNLVCDDANTIDFYRDVPGPTVAGGFQEYYYPIFSGKTCSLTANSCIVNGDCQNDETCDDSSLNYQLRITATALTPQACCLVNAGVPGCSLLTQPTCEGQGGYSIPNAPICFGTPCDLGSCCLPNGDCDDNDGAGISIAECNQQDGNYFGAALCTDEPCPVCEILAPGFCQTDNGQFILINDSEVQPNRFADDFRPTVSGLANNWCYSICFFNPSSQVECFSEPPADNFTMTIYSSAVNGDGAPLGLPGAVLMAQSPINVIAKLPEDIQTNRCWDYSFDLPNAPFLNAGECYWVQIEGTGDPGGQGCTVYVQTSADGNSYVLNDTDGTYGHEDVLQSIGPAPDKAVDLTFCSNLGLDVASGGCGEFNGMCCVSPFAKRCSGNLALCEIDGDCPIGQTCGDCVDDIGHNDCFALTGIPLPGLFCGVDECPDPCEQDDCITGEVPSLNDPDDPGNCDAGLLAGDCTRPYSNIFCDPTVIGTVCSVQGEPPGPNNAFGSDTWAVYTMQEGECGEVTFSSCPADGASFAGDGMLAAYVVPGGAGCPDAAGIINPTACGDDTCNLGGGPATVTVQAVEGQDIYLRMGGWEGDQGSGLLVISLDGVTCPEGVVRPNPNPELGLGVVAGGTIQPCFDAAECEAEGFGTVPNVDCIPDFEGNFPGTCYVSAGRYLSISPNPLNVSPTARRVVLDTNDNDVYDPGVDAILGWMTQPFDTIVAGPEPTPQAQAQLQEFSTGAFRNWNDLTDIHPDLTGAQPVHLGDCEITPVGSAGQGALIGNTYLIQAINLGADESDEANYSAPLRLRTTTRFGDPSGAGTLSNYPSQSVSLLDAFAGVKGFQGIQLVPKWRLEATGSGTPGNDNVPNFGNISLLDVFAIVGAFVSGGEYGFSQPCACDGQSCP